MLEIPDLLYHVLIEIYREWWQMEHLVEDAVRSAKESHGTAKRVFCLADTYLVFACFVHEWVLTVKSGVGVGVGDGEVAWAALLQHSVTADAHTSQDLLHFTNQPHLGLGTSNDASA